MFWRATVVCTELGFVRSAGVGCTTGCLREEVEDCGAGLFWHATVVCTELGFVRSAGVGRTVGCLCEEVEDCGVGSLPSPRNDDSVKM